MMYITREECEEVIAWVNGYPMTYGDYLDNTNQPFEVA